MNISLFNSISKLKSIDQGALFMILSTFFSALSGAVAKVLSDSMDPIEMVFYRNMPSKYYY